MTTPTPPPFDVFAYQRALRDSELPPTARHVALVLSTYASRKDGTAWPSQETLAKGSGWSRRSVVTALARLVAAGWLTRLQSGTRGQSTRYRLHLPQGGGPGPAVGVPAAPVRTSAQTGAQRSGDTEDVRCAGTPLGEPLHERPTGGVLAPPGDLPTDVWVGALPVFDAILGRLQADEAARFVEDWGTLAKARDFAWTLATVTGRRPGGRVAARWSVEDVADALTAVPLAGVTAPARALYARLMRFTGGAAPVPESPGPGVPKPREAWAPPAGPLGDVLAALSERLAMPDEYRTGPTLR